MKWGAVFSGLSDACRRLWLHACIVGCRCAQNFLEFVVDNGHALARIINCPGDVAQLGERLGRIEEVEGSIPFVSTTG